VQSCSPAEESLYLSQLAVFVCFIIEDGYIYNYNSMHACMGAELSTNYSRGPC